MSGQLKSIGIKPMTFDTYKNGSRVGSSTIGRLLKAPVETLDSIWQSDSPFTCAACKYELNRVGFINERGIWNPVMRGNHPSYKIEVRACWDSLTELKCVPERISMRKVSRLFNNTFSTVLDEDKSLHGMKIKDPGYRTIRQNLTECFSKLSIHSPEFEL
jgi:hypothetical protein